MDQKKKKKLTEQDRCMGNRLPKVAAMFGAKDASRGYQISEPVGMLSKHSGCVRLMWWRASKWTPAAVFGANLDACGWSFSCLSMMRLFWKFSQWCGCSENSPEGTDAFVLAFQWCSRTLHLQKKWFFFSSKVRLPSHAVVLLKKNPFKGVSLTSRLMRLFS